MNYNLANICKLFQKLTLKAFVNNMIIKEISFFFGTLLRGQLFCFRQNKLGPRVYITLSFQVM